MKKWMCVVWAVVLCAGHVQAWTVGSTSCWSTNAGELGLSYVISQINEGNGSSVIEFAFDGVGTHHVSCSATVSNRFVTMRTVSGNVRIAGTLNFRAGANIENCNMAGTVTCGGNGGQINNCQFPMNARLNLGDGYTVLNSTFSNVTITAGNTNLFADSNQFLGNNSPMSLTGNGNEILSGGDGVRLTVNGDGNTIMGVGLRSLDVGGNSNVIAGCTNVFNVGTYVCDITGTNNQVMGNVFHSDQLGSVRVIGDDNSIIDNTSYSNRVGFYVSGHRATLQNNRIGVLPDGLTPAPNNLYGIEIEGDNHVIGGTNVHDRNIIVSGYGDGIQVRPKGAMPSTNCLIQGNYVGLNANGEAVGSIKGNGIHVWTGHGHTIGGPGGARNAVGGCAWNGIYNSAPNTVIENNLVGLTPGNLPAPVATNGAYDGIRVATSNVTLRGNFVCSVLNGYGMNFSGHSSTGTVIAGNRIGTGLQGTNAFGNGRGGIYVINNSNLLIGGTNAADRNIIVASGSTSTNDGAGICFENNGASSHRVIGNYIGVGADGSTTLGNANYGVLIRGTHGVTVGGTNQADGNLIGGSGIAGVGILNGRNNVVRRNFIGTDALGENSCGNLHGVLLYNAENNLIGGHPVEFGNLISGNASNGVFFQQKSWSNQVMGNLIGTMSNGVDVLFNDGYGVAMEGVALYNSQYNWIGGTNHYNTYWRDGNVISGNGAGGIFINERCQYNYVDGNLIGLDTHGTNLVGNAGHGVHVREGRNQIGIVVGNDICANNGDGIRLEGSRAGWNHVYNNYIGVTRQNQTPFGNYANGIAILDGARYNYIGATRTNGFNVIGANYECGILITGESTGNNLKGNYIGFPQEYGRNTINEGPAIRVVDSRDTWIGGVNANQGNVLDGPIGIHLEGTASSWVYDNQIGFETNNYIVSTNLEYGIFLDNCSADSFGQSGYGNRIGGARIAALHAQDSQKVQLRYFEIGYTENSIGQPVTNAGAGIVLSNTVECAVRYSRIGGSGGGGILMENTLSNIVQACLVGAPDNDPFRPRRNGGVGIRIVNGRHDRIGADYYATSIITGNDGHGVEIVDSVGVRVQGSNIGLDEAGINVVSNGGHGVYILRGTNNTVGGSATYRNYIAGNGGDGVHIVGTGDAPEHLVAANRIGYFVPGNTAATNGGHGIVLDNLAGIVLGGTNENYANYIGGNLGHGILVTGSLSAAHAILMNTIGTDTHHRTNAVPNGRHGIALLAGQGHMVAGNLLAGNAGHGLLIQGTNVQGNEVNNNMIGTDRSGTRALPNLGDGLHIVDSPANIVSNNLISGNAGNGIVVSNSASPYSSAMNNRFTYNLIGTDMSGNYPVGNGNNGVLLSYVTFTHVGPANKISANLDDGVEVWGMASHDNFIQGNVIGGPTNLGNFGHGVQLHGGDANRVGSTNSWEANDISYNIGHGVAVFTGNQNPILGNMIYSNAFMGIRLGTNATPYPNVIGPGYPNNHQWAPIITNATLDDAYSLAIQGYLETGASQPYLVEYFLTESVNYSGYGEGKYLLHRETLETDAEGRAAIAVTLPEQMMAATGMIVTATARDTNRNSSAFSWAQILVDPDGPPPGPVAVTGVNPSGPATALTSETVEFNALYQPANATQPIAFTWTPTPATGQGTHLAEYQFASSGVYTIAVVAANDGGSATGQATIAVTDAPVQTGTVVGVIQPAGANTDGAGWRIVGADTNWLDSGASLGIPTGSYALEFKPLAGWQKPGDLLVNVQADTTHTVTGSYEYALSVSPSSFTLHPSSFTSTVQVTVGSGGSIPWTAATTTDWITLTGATNGTTSAEVIFSVQENEERTRTGTIQINDETVTIRQRGITSALGWLMLLFE